MQRPKIIAIVGPTASGKSGLGIYLAQKLTGEVISADSRQVYRGLDIGTGKVTKHEMQGVKHHLLDVANPKKQFTVDDFVRLSEQAVKKIKVLHTVIIVGGTGLYVDMLLGRMFYPNVPPNKKLRGQLERWSIKKLYATLKKLDPRRAATIEPHHQRRLIRAIEIAKAIGQSPLQNPAPKYDVLWLGLSPAPVKLKQNIRKRLLARMRSGMVHEARRLHKGGLSYKRMDELGLEYRYLALLLQKKLSQPEFMVQLERAINHYAKRQHRWFRRNKDIHWVSGKTEALRLSKKFLGGR